MLFEIRTTDDRHAHQLEWERCAAEQLHATESENLRPHRFCGDHRVNIAADECSAMAIGRQIDDLQIIYRESRGLQRTA